MHKAKAWLHKDTGRVISAEIDGLAMPSGSWTPLFEFDTLSSVEQRNRELTRQVEQLQERLKTETAIADRACAEQVELEARLDDLLRGWAEVERTMILSDDSHAKAILAMRDIASALTAHPSSSDPGRNDSKGIEGDTGREE